MNHREKKKLARKLRTHSELLGGISKFQTRGWELRKQAIAERVKKREERRKKKNV